MNRREILIGSVCGAISAKADSTKCELLSLSTQQSLGNGCIVSTKRRCSSGGQRTAVFVMGRCASAIAEITRLGLPIHTLAYFDGSVYGPNVAALFAEAWNISSESVDKIDDVTRFLHWAVATHTRFVIIGNFSAPFASSLLFHIAKKARLIDHPVFAIGGLPAAGAYGSTRTQWGWTCIRELRRIGCCVITVPEVEFEAERSDATRSTHQQVHHSFNEGSPFCRAIQLALNEVMYGPVAFDDDLLAATFKTGKVVSLGWGYSDCGDAATATRMALNNSGGIAATNCAPAKVLVLSQRKGSLDVLRTSTDMIFKAICGGTPLQFAMTDYCEPTSSKLQITLFR